METFYAPRNNLTPCPIIGDHLSLAREAGPGGAGEVYRKDIKRLPSYPSQQNTPPPVRALQARAVTMADSWNTLKRRWVRPEAASMAR